MFILWLDGNEFLLRSICHELITAFQAILDLITLQICNILIQLKQKLRLDELPPKHFISYEPENYEANFIIKLIAHIVGFQTEWIAQIKEFFFLLQSFCTCFMIKIRDFLFISVHRMRFSFAWTLSMPFDWIQDTYTHTHNWRQILLRYFWILFSFLFRIVFIWTFVSKIYGWWFGFVSFLLDTE